MYTENASERARCSELSFRPVILEVAYILFARSSSTFARLWVFLLSHILLLGILVIISFSGCIQLALVFAFHQWTSRSTQD